ncbi:MULTISPECIES: maleylpyruvate isomerase N-terminal domain-containing protein [Rhodococcus]|uniref:maleylpyruvate isomerase N-terminal domain-containing protein n=1 Tax=Rhodococcus TaxID=1827 RepID=UPI001C30FB00|nr:MULTISPECIES: maleylpyruvate isomerase N-terminal domain-containing protein [Rhodococcus]QXF83286.1 mycothiol maleylpyruvate isomerase [Rhodococcus pyridinivorans]QXU52516.1 maleylpyruvate isomerase N-terminal domain-containing protein [Rhodococcus sp. LW-XY12]
MESPVATYVSAVRSFAELVRAVPEGRWDGPGLGEWDLRALIGHTSRSLTTVMTYLDSPADTEDLASAEQYYVHVKELTSVLGAEDIVERGRRAGADLGDDPVATIGALSAAVIDRLGTGEDRLIRVIGGSGIRLHSYLPTRTFELAVHGLDIAAAADVPYEPPAEVLEQSALLAARIALALGDGTTVLRALTGRMALPNGYSVV